MREDLHEDPSVLMMARELGTRPEHIVGYCHRFWSWVSRQCHDGSVTNVTPEDVESVLNLPGFCRMLVRAGWLECHENGSQPCISIPKFERWLSQGGKTRRLAAERQRKKRHENVTEMSRDERDTSVTREEKRRVDIRKKSNQKKERSKEFQKPTLEDVAAYCLERQSEIDPGEFLAYYETNGWTQGKTAKPIKSWKAAVRYWDAKRLKEAKPVRPRLLTPEEEAKWTPYGDVR